MSKKLKMVIAALKQLNIHGCYILKYASKNNKEK